MSIDIVNQPPLPNHYQWSVVVMVSGIGLILMGKSVVLGLILLDQHCQHRHHHPHHRHPQSNSNCHLAPSLHKSQHQLAPNLFLKLDKIQRVGICMGRLGWMILKKHKIVKMVKNLKKMIKMVNQLQKPIKSPPSPPIPPQPSQPHLPTAPLRVVNRSFLHLM